MRVQNPRASPEQLAGVSLPVVCADPMLSADIGPVCRDRKMVGWATNFDVAVLLVTLSIPIAVSIAGRKCSRDRALLLRVFLPGLRIVIYCSAFLLLAQG